MKHKIVRSGNTVISGIRDFRYIEQVNDDRVLRWGACVSSSIEVTVFGGRSDAVATGETLTYYQTVDVDNTFTPLPNNGTQDILIGTFTAVSTVPGKTTYSFTAYDNIYKLGKTFVWTPSTADTLTYSQVLSSIATSCGVSFDYTTMPTDLLASTTRYFYSDGLTCRDVVSQFAEACGCFVRCKTNGTIEFARYVNTAPSYWKAPTNYFISPTDNMESLDGVLAPNYQSMIPIVYKQDGIHFTEYECAPYTYAEARSFDGKQIGAASIAGNGNSYVFGDNIIIENLKSFSNNYDWADICANTLNISTTYKGCEIHLFPFINPFRAGQIVQVADPYVGDWSVPTGSTGEKYAVWNSRIFNILVMKMEINNSMVVITCNGMDKVEVNSAAYSSIDRSLTTVRSVVNTTNDQMIKADSGSESFTLAANSMTTRTVYYNILFKSAPAVMLTLLTDTQAVSGGTMVGCSLQSAPTNESFVIKMFNSDTSQRQPVVRWLAVGN